MTAFASASGTSEGGEWRWEMRSVNGKGLDARLRLPTGYDSLEERIRKRLAERLSRGNIQLSLSLEGRARQAVPVVDEATLLAVLSEVKRVEALIETRPTSAAEILSIRNVLGWREATGEDDSAFIDALFAGFVSALDDFVLARESEGRALAAVLQAQLDEMAALAESLQQEVGLNAGRLEERYRENLTQLLPDQTIDEARLYQEVALLMTKADLREEIDRLQAHIVAGRELVDQGSPVGRKLEFLAQELNRETNTICAKSNDLTITRHGLALKAVVDQFREQSLNVE